MYTDHNISSDLVSMAEKSRVCVTGAGGYVASWLIKFLLSRNYIVHGTVRDPCDEKNDHLKKMENASDNLQLFKVDLLDYEAVCSAIEGCSGVFHVARPATAPNSDQEEMVEVAVCGTRNVLNACSKVGVKKIVVVSSTGAVAVNPNWPLDQPMDEDCWSDLESCRAMKIWYCLAKTLAEREALEYAKKSEINVISVCPSLVIGPRLQSTLNSSSLYLLKFLTDGSEPLNNGAQHFVDVCDVAEALLLVYENPKAEGRYMCSSHHINAQDLLEKLKIMYPDYYFPKSFGADTGMKKLSSKKLHNLGWTYSSFEETIVDAVNNHEERGD